MKITPLILTLIAAALFLPGSCKKEKKDDSNYLRASINGNNWEAGKIEIGYDLSSGPREITGITGDEKISLHLPTVAAGTYTFRLTKQNELQPVTLVNFDVESSPTQHKIKWETAMEVNTSQFIIEQSNDGSNWNPLNTQNATGTAHSYEVPINISAVSLGLHVFYRLKIVDTDNKIQYSPVKMVTMNYTAYYKPAGQIEWTGYHGTLEITSIDNTKKIMTGHFNFSVRSGTTGTLYTVTKGEFRTNY